MRTAFSRPVKNASRHSLASRRPIPQRRSIPKPQTVKVVQPKPTRDDLPWVQPSTILLSTYLVLTCESYLRQRQETIQVDAGLIAARDVFVLKAADTQYNQVDFDDPAQNLSHYKKLLGNLSARAAVDDWLTKSEGDLDRKKEFYKICRQTAKDVHLAIADVKEEDIVEVAQRIGARLERSLEDLTRLGVTQV